MRQSKGREGSGDGDSAQRDLDWRQVAPPTVRDSAHIRGRGMLPESFSDQLGGSLSMPNQSPYDVRCPSCGHSYVAGSNSQLEDGVHLTPQLVLRSWKEIACYVGSGVRSAQRWERERGLPVRRQCGHARGSVMAFPEELEAWLHSAPTGVLNRSNLATAVPWKQYARPGWGPVSHPAIR